MLPTRVPIPGLIDAGLEQRLRGELASGEQVLWSSQPLPTAYRSEIAAAIIAGLFWNGITWTVLIAFIYGMLHGKNGPPKALLLFFVPFVAIGIYIFAAPFLTRSKHRRTLYAVTDRRAMILTVSRRGGLTVETFHGERLTSMTRKQRTDGSGDLIFEQFHERRGSGSTTIKRGFIGIANVHEVEQLVTKTLLAERVRSV